MSKALECQECGRRVNRNAEKSIHRDKSCLATNSETEAHQ